MAGYIKVKYGQKENTNRRSYVYMDRKRRIRKWNNLLQRGYQKEFDLINKLENTLGSVAGYRELSPEGKRYHWQPAYVGYQQLMPEYRDCVDFKFKKTDIEKDKSEDSIKLQEI